eukprot:scaffold621387_cov27-Prasinocladus_malaysianus.AAC.1
MLEMTHACTKEVIAISVTMGRRQFRSRSDLRRQTSDLGRWRLDREVTGRSRPLRADISVRSRPDDIAWSRTDTE